MDCEKFDRVVLDLLYGELDELTGAAAKRHMDHCARCGPIGARLRATREVGVLPTTEPSSDLEARILQAERQAHARLPLRERIGRAVSVTAGYAMRPQLVMAALLLLVLTSSLLLLRARPGDRDAMRVTERGVPEVEGEAVIVPVPEQPPTSDPPAGTTQVPGVLRDKRSAGGDRAPNANGERKPAPAAASAASGNPDDAEPRQPQEKIEIDAGTDAYDEALTDYHQGRYAEAGRAFDALAAAGGDKAPSAALFAAKSVRNSAGCAVAAPRFAEVSARYPQTAVGNEAIWLAADCYRLLGQLDRARRSYQALTSAEGYRERVRRALASLPRPDRGRTAPRKDPQAPAASGHKPTRSPSVAAPAASGGD